MKRLVEARRHQRDWSIPDLPPLALDGGQAAAAAVTDATAQEIAGMRGRLASITPAAPQPPPPAAPPAPPVPTVVVPLGIHRRRAGVIRSVVRDLPDLAFRVAEHLLGLNRSLEEVVANHSGYGTEAVSYAFGLRTRFSMDDFPASAYHGPYLRMLWHHPSRGVDFIIRLINRACEAYAHPENRYEYIEPPEVVTIQLPDGIHEQYANDRLWGAYRGMSVAP